jgi:hypothetical protein
MKTLQWIDKLAERARLETIPPISIVAPRVEPAPYRLPRLAMSLSAVGSLAAACLLLAMGLHAQRVASTASVSTSTSSDTQSVLFSPLKMGVN